MAQHLKIGTGKSEIHLENGCLPTDNFIGIHDPLYARMILMEVEEGTEIRRYGILSLDLTSMFPGAVKEYKEILSKEADVAPEDSWITVTHNFTTPHLWEVPKPGEPDIPRPGHKVRTEEEIDRSRNTNAAFHLAAEEAARQAAGSLRQALCGSDEGVCFVNASRNMETKEGWWLGCDAEEFSDHTVPVLKFETPEGKPLALIYSYDCQSSVMGKSELKTGGKLITSDLLGNASVYVEKEYGDDFVALALCGAAGDQEPQLKANRTEVDLAGNMRTIDLGEDGFALLETQSARLGAELLKVSKRISCLGDQVAKQRRDFICETKMMERNIKKLHPTRSYDYVPEGEKTVEVQAFVLGDFAMLGTRAELASRTAAQIRQNSPFPHTLVATMVDGGAKYMVDADAYDCFTYGAMNSSFVKGSAEKLQAEGLKLLDEMNYSHLE